VIDNCKSAGIEIVERKAMTDTRGRAGVLLILSDKREVSFRGDRVVAIIRHNK